MVVVDGAGTPPALASGCVHSVAWYSSSLGASVLKHLQDGDSCLVDVLASAIAEVGDLHSGTCDLDHPGTPSAAVAIARLRETASGLLLDYLVLADCSVVLADGERVEVISDRREAEVGARFRTPEMWSHIDGPHHQEEIAAYMSDMRSVRNRRGGFWVAAADAAVASEAIRGTTALGRGAVVAVMSDGASRVFDLFEAMTVAQFVRALKDRGPEALIEELRRIEAGDPQGKRWPRAKRHDDASIALSSDREDTGNSR
ncbi:hypothetical protein [Microbacterium sp. 179-I 3D3 NHS]|uniref:hypothetical protein n=1 Tax=Microbacterium sp. 179-I 3D3 NHS TaxID=3142382 RepID=UPI0039A3D790